LPPSGTALPVLVFLGYLVFLVSLVYLSDSSPIASPFKNRPSLDGYGARIIINSKHQILNNIQITILQNPNSPFFVPFLAFFSLIHSSLPIFTLYLEISYQVKK